LLLLKGGLIKIENELKQIKNKRTWIEVQLQDDNPFYANQVIRELARSLGLTLLAVKIEKREKMLEATDMKVLHLDDLTVNEVFEKRLELENLESDDFEKELLFNFKKVVEKVENR
jgi:exonuclease SbcD